MEIIAWVNACKFSEKKKCGAYKSLKRFRQRLNHRRSKFLFDFSRSLHKYPFPDYIWNQMRFFLPQWLSIDLIPIAHVSTSKQTGNWRIC